VDCKTNNVKYIAYNKSKPILPWYKMSIFITIRLYCVKHIQRNKAGEMECITGVKLSFIM